MDPNDNLEKGNGVSMTPRNWIQQRKRLDMCVCNIEFDFIDGNWSERKEKTELQTEIQFRGETTRGCDLECVLDGDKLAFDSSISTLKMVQSELDTWSNGIYFTFKILRQKYIFCPHIYGVFLIWSLCFKTIQLGSCVFKPLSILPLELTPLEICLRGRQKLLSQTLFSHVSNKQIINK